MGRRRRADDHPRSDGDGLAIGPDVSPGLPRSGRGQPRIKALTHRTGPLLGRARLMSDSSSGVEIGVVEGFMAVRGSGAVARITFDDPEDWHWALDTWRGSSRADGLVCHHRFEKSIGTRRGEWR